MIYTHQVRHAMEICVYAHRDQYDIGGYPYAAHSIHIAEQMPDETTTIVALLHDVIEDTDYTLEMLEGHFSDEVLEAVALLTHMPDTKYMDYIKDIKLNYIARTVKLADLKHNCDTSRIPEAYLSEESTQKRLRKYRAAIGLLEE